MSKFKYILDSFAVRNKATTKGSRALDEIPGSYKNTHKPIGIRGKGGSSERSAGPKRPAVAKRARTPSTVEPTNVNLWWTQ